MYPSQTSLLPVSVVLAQFVADNGLSAFSLWYDAWFAGIPFRYVAEPVVPIILAALYRLTGVSLFDISIYFVLVSHLLGIIGWGFLVKKISGSTKYAVSAMLMLLIFPWRLFSFIYLHDASVVLSSSFLPFIFLTYWNLILADKGEKSPIVLAIISTTIGFLISVSIIPIIAVGVVAFIVIGWQLGDKHSEQIKRFTIVGIVSFLLVTLWYTPEYWIVLWQNPSLGGNSIVVVMSNLINILRGTLPLVVAVIVVFFKKTLRSSFSIFMTVWMGTFLLITFYRFISDYDFWMDWTRWFGELEVGLVLYIVHKHVCHNDTHKNIKMFIAIFATVVFITLFIFRAIDSPRPFYSDIPKEIEVVYTLLEDNVDSNRLYVSGTDTFWLNSNFNLPQLRGGNEMLALNQFWGHASFQLREGDDSELAKLWTDTFAISRVLVHSTSSINHYHDFRNTDKWNDVGTLGGADSGDYLFNLPGKGLVWSVSDEVLSSSAPEKGDDKDALIKYLSYRQDSVGFERINTSQYRLYPRSGAYLQFAMTYHKGWTAVDDSGRVLEIVSDPLGFMIIKTESNLPVTLNFEF